MARANRTPDDALRGWLVVTTLLLVLAGWMAGFRLYYRVPKSMIIKGVWFESHAPPIRVLWVGPFIGLRWGGLVHLRGHSWTTKIRRRRIYAPFARSAHGKPYALRLGAQGPKAEAGN